MQAYLVGGAVRDELMGIEKKDVDIVIVGSTHEEMVSLGYRPVGKDFTSYLGPQPGIEYSLARRSRKGGESDFGPEVTLEEDLLKRDLTINSMAMGGDGTLYDPFGGQADLQRKVLRMIRPSSFMEDPMRILRVARFTARYPDFTIDEDTMRVMRGMVAEGLLDDFVAERAWKEISRGLMEQKPSRMLQTLRACGALKVIMPELDRLYGVPQPVQWHPEVDTGLHVEQALDYAASQNFELAVRLAVMFHDLGKALTNPDEWPAHHGHEALGVGSVNIACQRLRVPEVLRLVAVMTAREHGNIHSAMKIKATTVVKVLRRCDAFRNPERFQWVLQASMCDARGRYSDEVSFLEQEYPQAMRFSGALWAAQQVKGGEIAAQYKDRPEYIPVAIHAARARAIKKFEYQQKETT